MRKSKIIKIDDKEITVKELRVKDILSVFDMAWQEGFDGWSEQIQTFLPKITAGISIEDLKKMAPSEIKQIVDAAKEVNNDFLAVARTLGLGKLIGDLKKTILSDFSGLLAGSLEAVMPMCGNMDTPFSQSQQTNIKKQKQNIL